MTRLVITSPDDELVLGDGNPRINSWMTPNRWWIDRDGIEGLDDPPAPRGQAEPIPNLHGAYWPARLLVASRILTIRGWHSARTSSLAAIEAREQLAALTNKPLTILAQTAAGNRWLTGFIASQPTVRARDAYKTAFTLIIECPDPLKYGDTVTFTGPGSVTVENTGREATWPVIRATGQVTSLRVSDGDRIVRWTGNRTGLTIDTFHGHATSGNTDVTSGLLDDDFFPIPPGRHELTVTADAPITIEVRPAWL